MSNNLINEISPYLLQHKNNPVNWMSWNSNTIKLVKGSKLPVLLSVGYSSCHWCHVMAHESFEDEYTASVMNKNFINIKVDREERPDLDSLYQASLSLMGQQGGWPLTMFLDNDLRPFWGGTYFPKIQKFGMPAFVEVLNHISNLYKTKNSDLRNNGMLIKGALDKVFFQNQPGKSSPSEIELLKAKILEMTDKERGGISGSPKFPMAPLLKTLMLTSISPSDQNNVSLNYVQNTIDSICSGGIYDHVGGGFARYSTDSSWFVPHFEKMLYDNALLVEVISVLHSVRPRSIYKKRVEDTFGWLNSEMLFKEDNLHGYFSSVDADSGGEEGKYYVWDYEEALSAVGPGFEKSLAEYGFTKNGNWEGKNIPHRIGKFLEKDISFEVSENTNIFLKNLLSKRKRRSPPFIDHKILTDWNSMLVCALLRAHCAFGEKKYLDEGKRVFNFITTKHLVNNQLFHSSCGGKLGGPGLLDDYANLIKACFIFNEVDVDKKKLDLAEMLLNVVLRDFFDEKLSDFCFTNNNFGDLFLKTKSVVDNATQSGSGLMVENLIRAYNVFGKPLHKDLSETIINNSWGRVCSGPVSYSSYIAGAYLKMSAPHFVVLLKDDGFAKIIKSLILSLGGFCTVSFLKDGDALPKNNPVFNKKAVDDKTTVYVCTGFVCSSPINDVVKMREWFKKNTGFSKTFYKKWGLL